MKEALATGLAGFAVYLLLVPVLLRMLNGVAPSLIVTLASVVVYAGTVAVAALSGHRVWFWPVSASYWFPALCLLMLFGALYKSISLRILLDLSRRPHRADLYEAVLRRYIEGESYQDRLRVMEAAGLAVRGSRDLRLTPKGRRIAAAVARVQALYEIERSG